MNYKITFFTLGQILKLYSIFFVLPLLTALADGEGTASIVAYLAPMLISAGLGYVLAKSPPDDRTFYAKEGFLIVGISWILISLIGTLPYVISTSGDARFSDIAFIDWFFESVSGFTTTGATILHISGGSHQIDMMFTGGYRSLLLFRSLSQWLGGMGVLLFVIAVLPETSSGASHIHLIQAETPGPTKGKLVSRVRGTARILYLIYGAFTLLLFGLLCIGIGFDKNMDAYQAAILSLSTVSTGGFAATSASLSAFSTYTHVVVMIFMAISGISFNLYYLIIIGSGLSAIKSEELRFYFLLLITVIIITTFDVWLTLKDTLEYTQSFWSTMQQTAFTSVAILTSTGFFSADFTVWPSLSQMLLLFMMFSGACSGSTSGGFKCSRLLILAKSTIVSIKKLVNPHAVYAVKLDGKRVPDEVVRSTYSYFSIYFGIAVLAVILISADTNALGTSDPMFTAFSAMLSCLNNIGPGLTQTIGTYGSYFAFFPLTKLLLTLLMFFGRLEIFPMLMLFSPRTYVK